ncbi:MAG: TatD family hydrolase [Candidatus Methylomirabilales bacterium]
MDTLIDSHAHPYMPEFDADREAMLDRARAAGVAAVVAIGYDLASSRQAAALAEQAADVFACVAIHPHHAGDATPAAMDELRGLAASPRVLGIGETGLDFYRNRAPRDAQEQAFRLHLALARSLALPVVVHDRDAHADTMRVLGEEAGSLPAVILHCFSGDLAMAAEAAARGYYVGVAGPVTYRSAGPLRAALRAVPLERLLLETDAPYLPPEPHRGRRNESAYLPRIAAALAELTGLPPGRLAAQTSRNAERAFARMRRPA